MKKLILFLFFITTTSVISQICGTEQYYLNTNQSSLVTQPIDETTQHVFNVRFHIVYNNDGLTRTNINGTEGLNIGENEVLEVIKKLNINFNQFNIFFKYYGFDTINNSNYLNNGNFSTVLAEMDNTYGFDNAFDMYVINAITGASAIAAYYGTRAVFNDTTLNTPYVVCHEMGHCFGLLHTFFFNGTCEHATRFYNPDDLPAVRFNADLFGDQIVDTHAFGDASETIHFDTNCNYIGGAIDCEGTLITPATVNDFLISGPPINNFMSSNNQFCQDYIFTPNQGVRMRNAISLLPETYNPSRTDVFSLFQPYSKSIITYPTVLSTTDYGDGTALICRGYNDAEFMFQPGFTYEFPENQSPEILTATNQDFPVIVHNPTFNCPVRILELGINQTNPNIINGQALTTCRGIVCLEEEVLQGTIITSQNLFGLNITIQELNQIQIKDPELYNNLLHNYYYKLIKETATGAKMEEVFYKP